MEKRGCGVKGVFSLGKWGQPLRTRPKVRSPKGLESKGGIYLDVTNEIGKKEKGGVNEGMIVMPLGGGGRRLILLKVGVKKKMGGKSGKKEVAKWVWTAGHGRVKGVKKSKVQKRHAKKGERRTGEKTKREKVNPNNNGHGGDI